MDDGEASKTGARVRVTGRVQGVGYRAWVRDEALRLDLQGWVRNDPDGAVSAVLHGSAEAVDRMVARMADGPALAAVDEVQVSDEAASAGPGFEIRR